MLVLASCVPAEQSPEVSAEWKSRGKGLASGRALWPNIVVIGKLKTAAGDELSVPGLVIGLVLLVPGALVLAIPPVVAAFSRLGSVGTAFLLLGIVVSSLAFFPAYEHLKPSSPPTPRRDLVVILFAALLIGLWTFLFSNPLVAFLVLGAAAAIVLLPDELLQRIADHSPL